MSARTSWYFGPKDDTFVRANGTGRELDADAGIKNLLKVMNAFESFGAGAAAFCWASKMQVTGTR